MTRTTTALLAFLCAAASGCGATTPTLAGGKPVSHWVAALQSPDAKTRKTAAFKLGNVGPADSAVVPTLVGSLKDVEPAVRCEAILALVKCGSDAKAALPTLSELEKNDPDATVRQYAAKALEKLRPRK
jgi:HEAT repeat protein